MNSDYIYLDGGNAQLQENSYLYWQIPPHYFKNYKNPNDEIHISLISASYNGAYAVNHGANIFSTSEILCNLNTSNLTSTNSQIKQLALCVVDCDTTGQSCSCNSLILPVPIYKTGRFNDIVLAILFQGELLDFNTENTEINKDYCKFMLKVDYLARS